MMRFIKVTHIRSFRNNPCGVNVTMRLIVMILNVNKVHGGLDNGVLEKISQISTEVGILFDHLLVAFEMSCE
jgi:hypothetical protein